MPEMIPASEIKWRDRQRKEYNNIPELAASIEKHGLFNAITLDDENYLIAGGRRFTAMLMLGWKEIPCERKGKIDPLQAKEMELEENLQREDLTWQEEQSAIAEIHRIKSATNKDWSADKTASMIGKSRRTVYNAIELDKAAKTYIEINQADTAYGAMLRLDRLKKIEKRQEEVQLAELAQKFGMDGKAPKTKANTYLGDAVEFFADLDDSSADCVFTNPPFGVNIEKLFKGSRKIYNDEPQAIYRMLELLYHQIYRVLKDDRWFVTYWPTTTLEVGKALLAECGFEFDPVPWIWYKPNKRVTAMGDPYDDVNIQYETFFMARKGKPKWSKIPLGNVIVHDTPSSDRLHPLQMPPEVWEETLQYVTHHGETVYEPFSGSGSGGVASLRLGLNYEGIELDTQFYERSQLWLAEEKLGVRSSHPPTNEAADD